MGNVECGIIRILKQVQKEEHTKRSVDMWASGESIDSDGLESQVPEKSGRVSSPHVARNRHSMNLKWGASAKWDSELISTQTLLF